MSTNALRFLDKYIEEPVTFGALLAAIRQTEEMSLQEFSEQLGISRTHLHDIEKRRRLVSAQRAAEFAEALGMAVPHFVSLALQDELDRSGLGDFNVRIELKRMAKGKIGVATQGKRKTKNKAG